MNKFPNLDLEMYTQILCWSSNFFSWTKSPNQSWMDTRIKEGEERSKMLHEKHEYASSMKSKRCFLHQRSKHMLMYKIVSQTP